MAKWNLQHVIKWVLLCVFILLALVIGVLRGVEKSQSIDIDLSTLVIIHETRWQFYDIEISSSREESPTFLSEILREIGVKTGLAGRQRVRTNYNVSLFRDRSWGHNPDGEDLRGLLNHPQFFLLYDEGRKPDLGRLREFLTHPELRKMDYDEIEREIEQIMVPHSTQP